MMKQMKKLYTVIIVLLIGSQVIFGQDKNAKLDSFRSDVLSKYQTYFTAATLDESGQLRLTAGESYSKLTSSDKKDIMNILLRSWQESLVILQFESNRELWGWNSETKDGQLIEVWNLNPQPRSAEPQTMQSDIAKHPWFFYIGGASQMDSFQNINGALSARLGFFLLLNKLDLAASVTEQLSGNIEDESSSLSTSVGLASKFYFPIQKHNISPNLGAELAVTIPSEGEIAFTPYFLAGVSWYVGPGSLDVGLRIGSSSMLMFGYTLIPKFKSGK
jgi:hypothetical protein